MIQKKNGKLETKHGITRPKLLLEVPLLAPSIKIPISIQVSEKYKIGDFAMSSPLDLAPGSGRTVEICYDPSNREFTGTCNGKEEQEMIATGDSNYFGERYHRVIFKITNTPFRAPTKAR